MKKYLVLALAMFVVALGLVFPTSAFATGNDETECVPADAWTETIEHPAVTHVEHHEAVTEVKHHDAVTHVEYHFAKFTHIKTKAPNTAGFWQNFEPNREQGTFTGPPTWPTDPRGTWSAKKTNGGPQQDASGVFQNGSGNGSWFYRAQAVESDWSDYGPWTEWVPETHTSWELSDAPLGSPAYHGSGTYADGTKWYREWQAQFDGDTRIIEDEPAYDETIIVTPAYDEVVVDEEAYDEVVTDEEAYDETVVDEEAWTETIEHEAVVCEPPVEEPPVVEPPVVEPPVVIVKTPPTKIVEKTPPVTKRLAPPVQEQVLPNTGVSGTLVGLALLGVVLVAAGYFLFRRKR